MRNSYLEMRNLYLEMRLLDLIKKSEFCCDQFGLVLDQIEYY